MGSFLLPPGASLFGLAFVLFGGSRTLVTAVGSRPKKARHWAAKKAADRVAAVVDHLDGPGHPLPVAELVSRDARRRQVTLRAIVLVAPTYLIGTLGFLSTRSRCLGTSRKAARARSGPSGLSAYVAAAVARQIERDNLNELISVAEADHGPIGEEEIQARRDILLQARRQQQRPSDPHAA